MADRKPGATGKFPEGKLRADDQGELYVAMSIRNGKVFLDFGAPVAWLAMNADDADKFGRALIDKAKQVSKGPP
jgi:hypothetical protein